MTLKKLFFSFLAALGILFLPQMVHARISSNFYNHCLPNTEFNAFANVDTIPDVEHGTMVEGDNGAIVAILQMPTDSSGFTESMEISGRTPRETTHVFLCEKEKIIAILPTYRQEESDTENRFKFTFDLTVTTETADYNGTTIVENADVITENEKYYTMVDGEETEHDMLPASACQNFNQDTEPFKELSDFTEAERASLVGCLTPEAKGDSAYLLGGFAHHMIYMAYMPLDADLDRGTFTLMNFLNLVPFSYAIMPPLETISGCNVSSIAKMSVENIRCFPMIRQVEFKRYFLGLPEVMERGFDFPFDVADCPAGERCNDESAPEMESPLLVNYFNEVIQQQEKNDLRPPQSGRFLDISKDMNGNYRYVKKGEGTIQCTIYNDDYTENQSCVEGFIGTGDTALISYYDIANETCPADGKLDSDTPDATCLAEYTDTYQCEVDPARVTDLLSTAGTTSLGGGSGLFAGGCGSDALSTDAATLASYTKLPEDDPKLIELQRINKQAQCVCWKLQKDNGLPVDDSKLVGCPDDPSGDTISVLQTINACSVEVTRYTADLDARYEGFGACEKIAAIDTMSGMMDRCLQILVDSTTL